MSIFDRLHEGIDTRTPEEMREVAAAFAGFCPEDATLALSGDLGAGKTVFVKGLAAAWGIEETVTSPTFTIFSLYSGSRHLIHMDAYRLGSADNIESLMIEEFLQSPYCLAVEWPERVAAWLPKESWKFRFELTGAGVHRVRLEKRPRGI